MQNNLSLMFIHYNEYPTKHFLIITLKIKIKIYIFTNWKGGVKIIAYFFLFKEEGYSIRVYNFLHILLVFTILQIRILKIKATSQPLMLKPGFYLQNYLPHFGGEGHFGILIWLPLKLYRQWIWLLSIELLSSEIAIIVFIFWTKHQNINWTFSSMNL